MKKIIVASIFCLLPVFLFSYEINFNKAFSKKVSPDLLTTYVNINISKIDESDANKEIEKFNDFIKDYDDVSAKDGTYNLSPRYKYVNKKQIFTGYVGSLRYKIESQNAKKLNRFISKLLEVKEKINSEDVKLNISNISWVISSELYNKSVDDLRIETIIWANKYANTLSAKISKNCAVEKININSINRRNLVYSREIMATSSKVAADISPQNNDEDITINPNFVLECK